MGIAFIHIQCFKREELLILLIGPQFSLDRLLKELLFLGVL